MNTRNIIAIVLPILVLTTGCADPFGTAAQEEAFEDALAAIEKQQEATLQARIEQALAEREAEEEAALKEAAEREAEIDAAVADALAEKEAENKANERRVVRPTGGSMSRPTGGRTSGSSTAMRRPTR